MNILDDFQDFSKGVSSFDTTTAGGIGFDFEEFNQEVAKRSKPEQRGEGRALFSIGSVILERNVTRGRGQVTAVSSARDVICIATARNFILRYNYSSESLDMSSSFENEIEIIKPFPDAKVCELFLDPSTHHLLINMKHPQGFETHYCHSSWNKTKLMSKLRNINITTVGWYRPTPPIRVAGMEDTDYRHFRDSLAEQTTREILLGSSSGSVYILAIDKSEKKEKTFKKIYDFKDPNIVICGVVQQQLDDGRYFTMIVTNMALYVLSGGPTVECVLSSYNSGQVALEPIWELPIPSKGSDVILSISIDGWPKQFCWMVENGIYHGKLNLSDSTAITENSEFVENLHLWNINRAPENSGIAKAMATTEYHFILMMTDTLLIVNRINGKCIQTISLPSKTSKIQGDPVGLTTDLITGIVYFYTTDCVVDVTSESEDKDVWKVYLEMQDFTNALNVSRTNEQKDEVLSAHADQVLTEGNTIKAAKLFAKMTGAVPTFEDITLRFIEMEDSDALQQFLQSKLDALGSEEKAQKTMVASWLTELLLDKINRALMEEAGETSEEYDKCVVQLRNFLKEKVNDLDVDTTVSLLGSYGRMDDLMHFADCRHDHETLLECLIQRRDVRRALGIMRLPSVPHEIIYKFAPELMVQAPSAAVDFWISKKDSLDPRRLLPALVAFGEPEMSQDARVHALRYIEFSIHSLGCQDTALHNLAIVLYSYDEDEMRLVNFIEHCEKNSLGSSLTFDSKYALRLVREKNKPRASVAILCVLNLYEDAIALALDVDVNLAKSVARSPKLTEDLLKRKLWLAIAKYVIQSDDDLEDISIPPDEKTSEDDTFIENNNSTREASIDRAMEVLKDANGLLKIEDILPFFPDFDTIDKFQEPIEKSLEDYNKEIKRLQFEMDEATEIADALRQDITVLETRTATITYDQPCTRCKAALGDKPLERNLPTGGSLPPFFAFPSELVYHGTCLCAEVMDLVGDRQRDVILALMKKLASIPVNYADAANGNANTGSSASLSVSDDVVSLKKQLEAEVAFECPRNGEIVIKMLDKPFVDPRSDKDEIRGFSINVSNNNNNTF